MVSNPTQGTMFCVYVFILCSCCPVFRQRPCDELITRPGSPTVCEIIMKLKIRGQGPRGLWSQWKKKLNLVTFIKTIIMVLADGKKWWKMKGLRTVRHIVPISDPYCGVNLWYIKYSYCSGFRHKMEFLKKILTASNLSMHSLHEIHKMNEHWASYLPYIWTLELLNWLR
jgi:hypothetical protein